MHQATTAGCGLALRLRLRTRESLFECENGNHNMKFSLRTLLLTMLLLGALPFWYQHFLIPFFVILAICIGMSVHAFGEGSQDETNFS